MSPVDHAAGAVWAQGGQVSGPAQRGQEAGSSGIALARTTLA